MENINIAELLKDCPTGMELDCTMFENVTLVRVDTNKRQFPIEIAVSGSLSKYLTKEGCFHDRTQVPESKCVIFPKGKTTWEGFVPPCQFKDGDIIYIKHKFGIEYVSIFRVEYEREICTYWDMNLSTNKLVGYPYNGNAFKVFKKDKVKEQRFATEEEKEKLFQAIKDNSYSWNTKTKTLEKLVKPKFKVGDMIVEKNGITKPFIISQVESEYYYINNKDSVGIIRVDGQDKYELVPNKFDINTLKPFDSRVLVRDSNYDEWRVSFWGCLRDSGYGYKYDTVRGVYRQCIPYEGNEHLLGKKDDCKDFYKTW